MLPEHIKKRGETFDEDYENFRNKSNIAGKSSGIAILFLMTSLFWYILSSEYGDLRIGITLLLASLFFILIIVGIVHAISAKPFKKTGIDYVFLNAYRAYLSLESYEQPGKSENKTSSYEEAKDEVDEIKWEIISGWKNFKNFNKVIPKLDSQINLFIMNIRKFVIALETKAFDTQTLRATLLELMKLFYSQENYDINKINKELSKYESIKLPTETPERIKDLLLKNRVHRHALWLSLFLVIGIIAGSIIFILDGDRNVQLTVGGAFSSILIGWYLKNIFKNKIEQINL